MSDNNPNETKLKIEISRYKSILEALDDPRKIRRIVGSILLIGILFFVGITIITITIKRIYPYSDIRTNMFGATTLRDESTEVTYWLFSTSELWANSGIKVNKNDILTIRSSGKTNTAIHHLYKYAKENRKMSHEWIDSDGHIRDGSGNELSGSDKLRSKYRIFPYQPQNSLIMQVVREGKQPDNTVSPENRDDFYYIGSEHNDLHINHSGTLHFAVNDIALTQEVIFRMQLENLICMYQYAANGSSDYQQQASSLRAEVLDKTLNGKMDLALLHDYNAPIHKIAFPFNDFKEQTDSLHQHLKNWLEKDSANYKAYQKLMEIDTSLGLGPYFHESAAEEDLGKNELNYYSEEEYVNAWFDDNIGSLLIVIERKN